MVTRFGRYLAVVGPGLHLVVPFVDRLEKIDLREVTITKRIEAGGTGRIRIGDREWDARTEGGEAIGPGTPIRITAVDGPVMVVAPA